MIKFKTGFLKRIEPVEVTRETAATIFIANDRGIEQRHAKRSSSINYFDTWAEAHQYLMTHAQRSVDYARMQLERANSSLGNIKGMKEPT